MVWVKIVHRFLACEKAVNILCKTEKNVDFLSTGCMQRVDHDLKKEVRAIKKNRFLQHGNGKNFSVEK